MADIARIQSKINKGRGKAGKILGQTFDVYRLNSTSTGSLVQPSNLIATVKMQVQRDEAKVDTEVNAIVRVPRFRGLFDITSFNIGDVFVERGDSFRPDEQKPYDGNMFTLAYFRPLREFVLMQTPITGQISRANNNPNAIDSGLVPYGAMAKPLEQYLVLRNGTYSWATSGAPAGIPIGLQVTGKRGELPTPSLRLPTDVHRQEWHVFTGLLPGMSLLESDVITAQNGDRYYVRIPYVGMVGLVGWQLVCEKLRV